MMSSRDDDEKKKNDDDDISTIIILADSRRHTRTHSAYAYDYASSQLRKRMPPPVHTKDTYKKEVCARILLQKYTV